MKTIVMILTIFVTALGFAQTKFPDSNNHVVVGSDPSETHITTSPTSGSVLCGKTVVVRTHGDTTNYQDPMVRRFFSLAKQAVIDAGGQPVFDIPELQQELNDRQMERGTDEVNQETMPQKGTLVRPEYYLYFDDKSDEPKESVQNNGLQVQIGEFAGTIGKVEETTTLTDHLTVELIDRNTGTTIRTWHVDACLSSKAGGNYFAIATRYGGFGKLYAHNSGDGLYEKTLLKGLAIWAGEVSNQTITQERRHSRF